jgi:hypothetical protein
MRIEAARQRANEAMTVLAILLIGVVAVGGRHSVALLVRGCVALFFGWLLISILS